MGYFKKTFENYRAQRRTQKEIKKILLSEDSEKVEAVQEIDEEKEIEKIILSIDNKQKRAEALEQNIDALNKDRLKKIIPTLNDDSILKLLKSQIKYLNNEEINILYTTISGISDNKKRIKAVDDFKFSLSDAELKSLLYDIKDKESSTYYEDKKIHILADKFIENYVSKGIILHVSDTLGCLKEEKSKLEVLKICLERSRKIDEKVKKGETKSALFDNKARMNLTSCVFSSIITEGKANSLDRQKENIVFTMFKNNEISYEQSRELIEQNIHNEYIKQHTLEALLKEQYMKTKNEEEIELKEVDSEEQDDGIER